MKLTKKQFNLLLNCHNGIGFVCVKTSASTVKSVDFFMTKKGEIKILNSQLHPPILILSDFCKEVDLEEDDDL